MDTELVLQQFTSLPEDLQFQVSKYIDFLLYNTKEEEPVSAEIKVLLDERIAKHKMNPQKTKSWQEIEDRLLKKYEYAV